MFNQIIKYIFYSFIYIIWVHASYELSLLRKSLVLLNYRILLRMQTLHAPADLRSIVWRTAAPDPGLCRGKLRERSRPSSHLDRYRRSPANESQLLQQYLARPHSITSGRSPPVACETQLKVTSIPLSL